MKRAILGAAVLGLMIGAGAALGTSGAENKTSGGALAGLKVGKPISLKDLGTAYEVLVIDEKIPTGEEVAEVGPDYLVVKSLAGFETRVPLTSIKSVVWMPVK